VRDQTPAQRVERDLASLMVAPDDEQLLTLCRECPLLGAAGAFIRTDLPTPATPPGLLGSSPSAKCGSARACTARLGASIRYPPSPAGKREQTPHGRVPQGARSTVCLHSNGGAAWPARPCGVQADRAASPTRRAPGGRRRAAAPRGRGGRLAARRSRSHCPTAGSRPPRRAQTRWRAGRHVDDLHRGLWVSQADLRGRSRRHPSTWPPSVAVRDASMAAITRRWSDGSRPPCTARNASPRRRKMSATSSAGRMGAVATREGG
jgi:hypothetical protein